MDHLLPWLGVLAGAVVAACCAAADGAMLSLDADGDLPANLRQLYARRERTHRALAFTRVLAQLTSGLCLALALGAVAAVLLVGASESLARSFGTVRGVQAASSLYRFIAVAERLFAPIASLGGWLDAALHRLLPPPSRPEDDREATAQQFKQVVATEAEVTMEQQILLNGVFRLGETEVHDLMVPRVDMVAIDRDTPWSEVVDRLRSSEHARLPVYAESIDDIIGMLYAKDVLPVIVADEVPDDWTTLVRPATFIPGAKKADAQLRDFQSSGTHIAIVADEFGGTAGLVTIEDVLEEIVGDIRDEYDEDETPVEQEDGERFWVSARLTLDELSELVGKDFHRDDVSTVGGLVYELLGRVPRAGEELSLNGFRVVVERVTRRRVERVYFERVPVPAVAPDAEGAT